MSSKQSIDPAIVVDLVRDSLARGLQPKLTIVSKSMTPLLRINDTITVEACAPEQLRTGDIVVFSAENTLYTHRFCRMVPHGAEQLLLTRGDRPLAYDPLWRGDALIGRGIAIERGNHILPLNAGAGHKLNQRLAMLARWEEKLFANKDTSLSFADLAVPNNRLLAQAWRKGVFRPIFTLIRGKFYGWRLALIKNAELQQRRSQRT